MTERKVGKRPHLTVCWYERQETASMDGGLYVERLCFRYRYLHLKGSNRPRGYYHDSYDRKATVEVAWLWTEKLGHFRMEVTFEPSRLSIKASEKIATAVAKLNYRDITPEQLCEALEVMIVESVPNDGAAYDDYVSVRQVGEPAMVTLARAAL
jgi:hypothetical protein